MPHPRRADGLPALLLLCALAAATMLIATLGVAPAQVSAQALLGSLRQPGESAFIAGHRGGADAAPENTLPAVRAALDAGYDYVEVDLQLTVDGHAVLHHDATVDRTTDGHGRLAELTLAQVRELDAGSSFSARFAGTGVPTAEEFLDVLAAHHGRAILDLKGRWDAAAAGRLVEAVAQRDLEDQVVVASFDARTLADIAARSTVIARLAILRALPPDVVEAARQAGVRGVVVDRKALLRAPELVDRLHEADLRVVVYTLNSDRQWDAVTELGVDGIVTDDPQTLERWQRASADG
ncbi:glycerophosphodiester phosphodiesterase family protein [Microbacterium sp. W1N]|uniref:glycerophosphodiester phosphodiesterase n=1 Tax=Microbacterium festucae TaxID=2977531 RepID=UPI0021C0BE87|nr:glycerophosphodiester phosphodiesterase family protein [Microbacterium festucae]MCT9821553.1 glycerophosphodiester phosphodiesterase family protein [Microbacterium festucae]